jgi:hypothetical protein
MQTIPEASPVSPSVTRGFTILLVFFLRLLIFELLLGEALRVPAKSREQPVKYWVVLAVQVSADLLFVAVLHFLTH